MTDVTDSLKNIPYVRARVARQSGNPSNPSLARISVISVGVAVAVRFGPEGDAVMPRAPPVSRHFSNLRAAISSEKALDRAHVLTCALCPFTPVGEQFDTPRGGLAQQAALLDPLPSASSASKYSSVADTTLAGGFKSSWRCQAAALDRPRQNAVSFLEQLFGQPAVRVVRAGSSP